LSQLFEILDDLRHHGQLADLADAKVKDDFVDVPGRFGIGVLDGVDQAQEAGGQAGIAAYDFRDLRVLALVCDQQFEQGGINRAQRRQTSTAA
jgi:hypothetical protein